MTRITAALLLCLSTPVLAGEKARDAIPGLVAAQPREGRFVQTDRGFMVPYQVQIAGENVSFEMVPIPGGKFRFGSPEGEPGRKADEGPQVEVRVEPFWMGKYEVTWGEYKAFMKLNRGFRRLEMHKLRPANKDHPLDTVSAPSEIYDPTFVYEKGDSPTQPAVTMRQFAAKQYTKWLSLLTDQTFRLPCEAEWEYAARGGSPAAWSFGGNAQQLAEHAWSKNNSEDTTHRVGQKKPNEFGLHDMHGNVAEWCLDEYQAEAYRRLAGKQPAALETILWPTKVFPRVIRGGSFESDAAQCRSAAQIGSNDREWSETDPAYPPSPHWFSDSPSLAVGFRILRPLNPPPRAERVKFWDADVKEIAEGEAAYEQNGHSRKGVVDPRLPEVIRELEEKERQKK